MTYMKIQAVAETYFVGLLKDLKSIAYLPPLCSYFVRLSENVPKELFSALVYTKVSITIMYSSNSN
jgi:hypothetical protein